MERLKRILALAAVVVLVGLYAAAFVFSLMGGDTAYALFRAALGATVLVPVFAYLVFITIRMIKPVKSAVADVIIFDMGKVLLTFPWENFAEEMGISEESVEAIKERAKPSRYWKEYDLGLRTRDEITDDAVSLVPEYEKEFRIFMGSFHRCVHKFWYTDEWIRGLKRKGYKLYYLSNWNRECADELKKNGTLNFMNYMDGGVWSFEEHIMKPDPEIYKRLIEKNNLDPSRCIFIDDLDANVRAAQKAGFGGIIFTGYEDAREKLEAIGVKW